MRRAMMASILCLLHMVCGWCRWRGVSLWCYEFQCGFMQWLEWHQRIGFVKFIHWWEDEHDCCRWMGLSISLMGLWVLCSVIEFGLATSLVIWCIVCYRWSWLVDFIDEAVHMRPTITVLVDVASRGGKSGLSNKPISHNLSVSLNKTTQRRTRSSRKWSIPAPPTKWRIHPTARNASYFERSDQIAVHSEHISPKQVRPGLAMPACCLLNSRISNSSVFHSENAFSWKIEGAVEHVVGEHVDDSLEGYYNHISTSPANLSRGKTKQTKLI